MGCGASSTNVVSAAEDAGGGGKHGQLNGKPKHSLTEEHVENINADYLKQLRESRLRHWGEDFADKAPPRRRETVDGYMGPVKPSQKNPSNGSESEDEYEEIIFQALTPSQVRDGVLLVCALL